MQFSLMERNKRDLTTNVKCKIYYFNVFNYHKKIRCQYLITFCAQFSFFRVIAAEVFYARVDDIQINFMSLVSLAMVLVAVVQICLASIQMFKVTLIGLMMS